MSIINQNKPNTSLTNISRISIGESWSSITTTYASETRTWADMASLIDNISLGITGYLWSIKRFPWTEATPWLSEGGISNQSKPI